MVQNNISIIDITFNYYEKIMNLLLIILKISGLNFLEIIY